MSAEGICGALASVALVLMFALSWSGPTGWSSFASGIVIGLTTAVIIYRHHPSPTGDKP